MATEPRESDDDYRIDDFWTLWGNFEKDVTDNAEGRGVDQGVLRDQFRSFLIYCGTTELAAVRRRLGHLETDLAELVGRLGGEQPDQVGARDRGRGGQTELPLGAELPTPAAPQERLIDRIKRGPQPPAERPADQGPTALPTPQAQPVDTAKSGARSTGQGGGASRAGGQGGRRRL